MFTTLAKVRIADAQRFIDVFSTHGRAKRRAHGSRGALEQPKFTVLERRGQSES
jgi:hypothetical protein